MKETLSDEEEKRLRKQLREHRELKQRGIRSTNRAAAADAMQNANRVGDVVRHVYCRIFPSLTPSNS
jgi:ribosomal protein S17